MNKTSRETVSQAIAQLVPHIIQGAQLGLLSNRNITHTQFFVLLAVYSNQSCSMTTLAEKMRVAMPTMTGIVDRLSRNGHVKRLSHPEDRRQVVVELTPKGKQLIVNFQTIVSRRWQEVLENLSSEEVELFFLVVSKLTGSLRSGKQYDSTAH